CWIGRAPFSGDNYLSNTLVYDFCVYNEALNTTEIATLAGLTDELDKQFRYGSAGDFSNLKTTVADAKTFLNDLETSDYAINAVTELVDAITIAENAISEAKVNQELIDEYETNVKSAKTKLTKTKGFVFDISDVIYGYDYTNRGFKHPGGLHTQADFERIKAQLAAGNEKVTAAYKQLTSNPYSSPTAATSPTETIIRGGADNYMNAARGAHIAYMNALRWKIEGNEKCAKHAVDVLMAWARTTKLVTGDSNQCLAKGIYGYEFAQAAELMRDYEGWAKEDFQTYCRWMLDVWYPGCMNFLRVRNATWKNEGKWWQAPGHYWSNWPLCNALAVISIGILCDDVNIYNYGMSFIKYDQCGTFKDPRTYETTTRDGVELKFIKNDGLTDFWGNLIVTTTESELETGAYGKLGQMQESGRDLGHCSLALGFATDIAQTAYNQGDDLFSYMDNRLAAGVEFVAAQTQNVKNLPWENYSWISSGYYYTDSRCWIMTAPIDGAQIRNYWGTIIGHYEGVKGVKMPFAEMAYEDMGIDGGGSGTTSGGYDHLGYSVLMHTYDGLASQDKVPTLLTPKMTVNGKTIYHNELGGLKNNYDITPIADRGVAPGTVITLTPCLPDGTNDTGKWKWNTGETSREITITANRSFVYRATYTNENGIESEQAFTIAVLGDTHETDLRGTITYEGSSVNDTVIQVMYGKAVTLSVTDNVYFCNYLWDNGQTTSSITIPQITSSRDVKCYIQNVHGRKQLITFHISVVSVRPDIIINGTTLQDTLNIIVNEGDNVVLSPYVSDILSYGTWEWDNGSNEQSLTLNEIEKSQENTVSYNVDEKKYTLTYMLYVKEKKDRLIESGNYLIRYRNTDSYLTNNGTTASFQEQTNGNEQIWFINHTGTNARYTLISLKDSLSMNSSGKMSSLALPTHCATFAAGTDYCSFYNSSKKYWYLDEENNLVLNSKTILDSFDFELIPYTGDVNSVESVNNESTNAIEYYSINGVKQDRLKEGINVVKDSNGDYKKVFMR
ncbi:MAG: alginate lyase family protein, partial [Bacteroidaceae bacterium]|nr:alginate lyase family protein [Bacteroidaceae bacterium]